MRIYRAQTDDGCVVLQPEIWRPSHDASAPTGPSGRSSPRWGRLTVTALAKALPYSWAEQEQRIGWDDIQVAN
jgi:hypothetical protein